MKISGRYEIREKLGQGGMGIVYRAFDPAPMNRDVAIKTLLATPDRLALDLFLKECNILKSISHPNIIEIFDLGEFDDGGHRKPYFVMPLLPGQTLDTLIRTERHRLSVERIVEIMSQTCRGLQAAHDRGLIHRDLKPSNIFVMPDDSVKIIDFGVAHMVDAHSRSSGFSKGTLIYMAPEQVQHKPVSPQSDLFSLGVVCYEALTKRQPFRGASEDEVVRAILTSIPPTATDINPAVSHMVSRVVHKAMAKQPWNRFDSAREFGETLQRAFRNLPIDLFDPARLQPRIQRAAKALEGGDYQFAGEIISELEAGGELDPQITLLRTHIDQVTRTKTIAQFLESARARFEEEEDPLALQKIQEILQLDPNHAAALGLKSKIEERRSERQIEKWLRLARQHAENHSYPHATEAINNVLTLRPKDSRALRLMKEIETEEQEYLKVRRQKADLYQAAMDAWKNGDISHALSRMKVVLELDRNAPDTSSPEAGATYQVFFNKIRSEHEAINTAYADAKRSLAEREFDKALDLCREYLEKYPGQALFQALKFDVEEQQRQQLSAFIADVGRRLDSEPDLDAKVSLLREAAELYPDEPHFKRSLKLVEEKRDLVNSIVARARMREERGQITEALSDFETLATIHSQYPGLKFEKERLDKRQAQKTRDAAKAAWVTQIDRHLQATNFTRAIELLDNAQAEFPDDEELTLLRDLALQGIERAQRAQELLVKGQDLVATGEFDRGIESLSNALELDDRPTVRTTLRDLLVKQAQVMLDRNWREAETLIERALELEPSHALARSLRSQVIDKKRDDTVTEVTSHARRLQAAGDIAGAAAHVETALATYPSEQRLLSLLETLKTELSGRSRSRASGVDAMRASRPGVQAASKGQPLEDATRLMSTNSRAAANPEPVASSAFVEAGADQRPVDATILRPHSAAAATGAPAPAAAAPPAAAQPAAAPAAKPAARSTTAKPRRGWAGIAAGVAVLVVAAAIVAAVWRPTAPETAVVAPVASVVPVDIETSPPGATIRIDNEARGTSNLRVDLGIGDHQVEAILDGYEPATATVTVTAGSTPRTLLTLTPIAGMPTATTPEAPLGTTPGITTVKIPDEPVARFTVQQAVPGMQVSVDDVVVGTVNAAGTFSYAGIMPGRHTLQFAAPGYEPRRITRDFTAGEVVTMSGADALLQRSIATLDVVADAATEVTVTRGTQPVDRFTGPKRLSVPIGAYSVAARGTAGGPSSLNVTLGAGETRTLDLRKLLPTGMELFGPLARWTKKDNWLSRRGGGFMLYERLRPLGRISFTLRVPHSRNPFSGGPKTRWVVNYVDRANYVLIEVDEKNFQRSEVVDGKSRDVVRKPNVIPEDDQFAYISVSVRDEQLVHQISRNGQEWKVIDNWERGTAGRRPLGEGKFGFYMPGDDEIALSDFIFQPLTER